MNLTSIIRKSTVCYLWLEGEPVIGTFFIDGSGVFTGIHFRSSICPNFIKQDNEAANETEQSGMTGFCAEVSNIQTREHLFARSRANRRMSASFASVLTRVKRSIASAF